MSQESTDRTLLTQALYLANNNQAELGRDIGYSRQYMNNFVGGRPLTDEIRTKLSSYIEKTRIAKQQEIQRLGLGQH